MLVKFPVIFRPPVGRKILGYSMILTFYVPALGPTFHRCKRNLIRGYMELERAVRKTEMLDIFKLESTEQNWKNSLNLESSG